ncbi:MAG: TIGR04255 family protein, partial [Bacteroidota bacterium]
LPKAPLQEAIFEIRWELELDPASGQLYDPGFQLAQGKLQDIAKGRFPFFNRKLPHVLPEQMLHYQVVNQYWTAKDTWPVIQLGPGIFTVNDTDITYDWATSYFPLIKESLSWLFKVYERPPKITAAILRYVDSVKLKDYGFEGRWREFVTEHFKLSFVNNFDTRGNLKALQFSQSFELPDKSELHLSMNSGKYRKTDDDALIWQTIVAKQDGFDASSILAWLEGAHTATSSLFKDMTKPHFYDSFK